MRYDERISRVLRYLRAAKHGEEIRRLLEKLYIVYPDNKASAYTMFRRDVRQFNAEIGKALGCSISVAGRPARCVFHVVGLEQDQIRAAD